MKIIDTHRYSFYTLSITKELFLLSIILLIKIITIILHYSHLHHYYVFFLVSASGNGNGGYCRQATVPGSVDTEQYTVIWRDTNGDPTCATRMRLIDKKTGEASAAQGCTGNIRNYRLSLLSTLRSAALSSASRSTVSRKVAIPIILLLPSDW